MMRKSRLKCVYRLFLFILAAMLGLSLYPLNAQAAARYEILMLGDDDEYVEALQKKLKELGFFDAKVTGYFGTLTQQAVVDFQTVNELKADGKAGTRTLGALMGKGFSLPENRAVSGSQTTDTLYPGDKGSCVEALQKRLQELEYYTYPSITGYYGPVTSAAVRQFQRTNQLKTDGVAGAETLTLLFTDDAKSYILYPGDRNKDVAIMQARLFELGYFSGNPTGYFGTLTQQALKEFQALCGLKVDAKAGKETRARLFAKDAAKWDGITRTESVSTPVSSSVDKMLGFAQTQLGKSYLYGADGPVNFDSSGFVYYVLKYMGVSTPRYSASGFSRVKSWAKISDINALLPGDILFFCFDDTERINHTAIYMGDSKLIHAKSENGVCITALADQYSDCFSFARRIY